MGKEPAITVAISSPSTEWDTWSPPLSSQPGSQSSFSNPGPLLGLLPRLPSRPGANTGLCLQPYSPSPCPVQEAPTLDEAGVVGETAPHGCSGFLPAGHLNLCWLCPRIRSHPRCCPAASGSCLQALAHAWGHRPRRPPLLSSPRSQRSWHPQAHPCQGEERGRGGGRCGEGYSEDDHSGWWARAAGPVSTSCQLPSLCQGHSWETPGQCTLKSPPSRPLPSPPAPQGGHCLTNPHFFGCYHCGLSCHEPTGRTLWCCLPRPTHTHSILFCTHE